MAYGSVNVPGAVATPEHSGAMGADDKRTLETLKSLVPFTLMERAADGNPATFVDGIADTAFKDLRVTIAPTQSGSGDPSPTNVRPISGASSVSVTRTGKNILDSSHLLKASGWSVDASSVYSGRVGALAPLFGAGIGYPVGFSFKPNTRYTFSADVKVTPDTPNTNVLLVQFFYTDGERSDVLRVNATEFTHFSGTSTSGKDISYLSVSFANGGTAHIKNIQLEESTTETAYEPYQGQTVTVQLTDGSNPLTVYGGTLNVTTGELTVDYALAVLNSSYTHSVYSGGGLWLYRLKQNGILPSLVGADVACSHYCAISNYGIGWDYLPNGQCRIADNYFGFRDTRFETRDDANAYLDEQEAAGTPVTICYRIAPVTYQLTPAQLAALSGYNTVFSADAAALSVTYRANPALAYAELESNLTNAILSLGAGI